MEDIHPAGSRFLPGLGLASLVLAMILSCVGVQGNYPQPGMSGGPTVGVFVILLAGFFTTLSLILFGLYFYSWVLMRHEIWTRNRWGGQ